MQKAIKGFLTSKIGDIPEIRDDYGTVVTLLDANFPHISNAICAVWGTARFHSYMETLLVSDRNDREGLPFDVLSELLTIIRIHDKHYPNVRRTYTENKITGF